MPAEEIYQRLAEHLDHLPGGFSPSETGAHLRLLQRLFTPEEAELATHLTLDREEARVIAERAGLPVIETEKRLEEMAQKGLIFSIHPKDSPALYQAIPFVVGIWEFQVNRMSMGLLKDLGDWRQTRQRRPVTEITHQMRTIPVGQSIPVHLEVLPYDQIDKLIEAQERFAVAPCICRRRARMTGGGCKAPEESCLMFGEWADYYARTGRGRYIDRSKLKEILKRADAANLVLQPSNSQKIAFLCCCCSCCCGILRAIQSHPQPSQIACSSFISRLEPDKCNSCFTCLKRCQMQAIAADGDHVTLKTERCIGCGLCVSTCPTGALRLERRPDSEKLTTPVTLDATWRTLSKL